MAIRVSCRHTTQSKRSRCPIALPCQTLVLSTVAKTARSNPAPFQTTTHSYAEPPPLRPGLGCPVQVEDDLRVGRRTSRRAQLVDVCPSSLDRNSHAETSRERIFVCISDLFDLVRAL
ncbi:uncharacterized protein SCHCODRAFT_02627683 [Schizophyllum commune H4-8]|uniref:uncharacterized protein n=1 Tax=Schizophyllum commune (strain H4-8 / FGSC 9210) TaxID=578458 RepID=UPI0021610715|nr:uncharacterized protein SCHCODRAFT_02627683 [Schizophyllum commune H4-8]KAI5890937.1 hypothetical protein SCHCODRAFT_02627683 [Schizophyllum commune H4-8]